LTSGYRQTTALHSWHIIEPRSCDLVGQVIDLLSAQPFCTVNTLIITQPHRNV
jgi:hypothetical protein